MGIAVWLARVGMGGVVKDEKNSDALIWQQTEAEHPTEDGEFGYGDSAYAGCEDIVTNFQPLNNNDQLTADEENFNYRMNQVRARVEHAVREQVEGKQMFQNKFRGSPEFLNACHIITAHVNRRARKLTGLKYEPDWAQYGPHDIY